LKWQDDKEPRETESEFLSSIIPSNLWILNTRYSGTAPARLYEYMHLHLHLHYNSEGSYDEMQTRIEREKDT
jgi:hypothetical protein